jgi:sugar lactone lactonase YvrE
MMPALKAFADRLLGRGDATITVPSFDGALKPNQILEKAETIGQFDAPEDLATDGKALYIADGSTVLRLDGTVTTEVRRFERTITALCCLSDGGMAAALDGREVRVFATPSASSPRATVSDPALNAINALSPGPQGTLIATDGSTTRPYRQWVYDLMERGRTGKVLSLDIASGSVRPIASGLSFAFGACAAGEDVLVSESWRHRLIAVAADGSQRAVLDNLPVYPSRLSPAASGGFWLTAFAARTSSSNSCCVKMPTGAA